jgi:hypothetical protein
MVCNKKQQPRQPASNPPATRQQPASNPQCGPRHVRRMKSANTLGRSAPCCEDLAPKINVQFGILGDICSKLLGMFQTVKNTNSLQHGHCIPQTWPNLGPRAKKNTVYSRLVDILDCSCLQQGFEGIPSAEYKYLPNKTTLV